MIDHTRGIWTVERVAHSRIAGATFNRIMCGATPIADPLQTCELGSDAPDESEENAGRIVTCVNAHDDLVSALAQIDANCAESPEWIRRVARAALAKVQS